MVNFGMAVLVLIVHKRASGHLLYDRTGSGAIALVALISRMLISI